VDVNDNLEIEHDTHIMFNHFLIWEAQPLIYELKGSLCCY
jgi:hypothetical protein